MKKSLSIPESQLRAVIETAVEGIITIDITGVIHSFNPAAEKIFSYSANDVIGNSVSMLMPEPYQHQHDSYIQNYIDSGNAKIIGSGRELEGKRKDGTEFPIWLSVTEFFEDSQQFFTGFIRDLTVEKNYSEKISSLEQILENSVNEIYIFDAESLYFIHANKGALDNLGFSSDEIIKLTPVDIKPDFSIEKFQKIIRPLRNGEVEKIMLTTMHQRKDNSSYPVEVHIEFTRYASKPAFVAIILDITLRKIAEEKAILSEEEFRLIFENAPTGVAVIDLDGNYTNVNPVLCNMLGYSKPEFLTLSYKDITHPDDIDKSSEYLYKLLKGEFAGFSIDKRYIRKDRKTINVILNVAIVHENIALAHDAAGNPALLISHIVDVTEEIEVEEKNNALQEQLAHMDRISMMGEMAAGIAHEINQPLTAIDTYAQAAHRRIHADNIDYGKLQDLLEKISNTSQRAGDVVSRLRAMVKRQTRKSSSLSINTLIDDAIRLLETDTRVYEFRIKLELDQGLPNVIADSIQIQQVLLNLIRNAMDATAKEVDQFKEITICSSYLAGENRIRVSVKDYGCGIEQDTAEELFNPFFTTKKTGLGIGLSICKSIIQTHGGSLWFLPNADKGTTFHFTLPTVLDEHE
ncbi:MAG: PAS domain S-box protein [Gammaproteobacteria bacterium]